jgi:phosphatidyl-myo-inositol alpha-mannosyltransferase
MRVALVCPYTWTVPGGVQAHVAGLARALRARGHEVDVLAPADGPVDFPGFVALGRSIAIPDNRSIVRVALSPGAAARTLARLRERRYDVVHLHEPMIPAVCLSALLGARPALVGTFHMYSERPRWYRPFAPLARRAVARLDVRIAVSEAARRHVARTVTGDYLVIPNGIDLATHAARRGRPPGREPVLLFVGRPEPRKGLPVLLEAFARLPGEARLELVGPEESEIDQAEVLPSSARARIRAHGRVSDETRLRLLHEADVLCAPSLAGESFGLVLVEGMAAGLPVVASALPGYVDVLPPSCGRLVPPGDAAALADALAGLLADPALRARLGAAGLRAARRFDWSRVVEEVLAVYEAVTCSSSRGRVSSGSKPIRAAISSLDGLVPRTNRSRRNAPVSGRSHQSSPTVSRR